jgi:hypothetical protein
MEDEEEESVSISSDEMQEMFDEELKKQNFTAEEMTLLNKFGNMEHDNFDKYRPGLKADLD